MVVHYLLVRFSFIHNNNMDVSLYVSLWVLVHLCEHVYMCTFACARVYTAFTRTCAIVHLQAKAQMPRVPIPIPALGGPAVERAPSPSMLWLLKREVVRQGQSNWEGRGCKAPFSKASNSLTANHALNQLTVDQCVLHYFSYCLGVNEAQVHDAADVLCPLVACNCQSGF